MRNPERLKAVLRLGGFAVAVVLLVSFVSTSCAPPQNSPLPPAGVPPVTGYDTVEDLISDPRLMVFRPPFPAGLAEAGSRNFGGRVLVTGKAVCQKVKDTKPVSKQITKDGGTLIHPNGHSLFVPPGAITNTADFTMSEADSGTDFNLEITSNAVFTAGDSIYLTVDYEDRCSKYCKNGSESHLSVHPALKLADGTYANWGGVDDDATCRTYNAPIGHLSTYTLSIP